MKQIKLGDIVEVKAPKKENVVWERNGTIGIVTEEGKDYIRMCIIIPNSFLAPYVKSLGADDWGFYRKHVKFLTHAEA
jgi:hypothetical protein